MKVYSWLAKAIAYTTLFLLLLLGALPAAPVQAQGSIAISGSFYRQRFEIPQGSSASGSSIDVVVFNQSDEQIGVKMVTEAPPGVTIDLSDTEFLIPPRGQKEVLVGVQVGPDAVPGEYPDGLSVIAQRYSMGEEGIVILGSAGEQASLTISGDAASVSVDTVSPSGDRVYTDISLFKIIGGEKYEFADSHTGNLQTKVSPGTFVVYAYSRGVELASQDFGVAAGDDKSLTLTVKTIYFKSFGVVPATNTETGEMGYVQVSYTIANVYEPVSNAEVRLIVTRDGVPLDETTMLTMGVLDVGDMGVPYRYTTPPDSWERGTYGFSLQLYVDEQLYASTTEQTLAVDVGGASRSWMWILLGVLGGGLGLLILGVLVWRRRKRGDRPVKFEKRRQPAMGGKETGVAGVFASRGILDKDGSYKMKPAAARPGGNGKGTVLAQATGVEKEKAGLSAAVILKKIKVWERIGRFHKKGGGNGHDGGGRPAGGQGPVGKQASVARTTDVAKSAPPVAAGGLPRQSNIVKEAAMQKPSPPATGDATKEDIAKQATVFKTPDVAKQTPPAVAGGRDNESNVLKAAGIQKPSPAISEAAKGNVATPATGDVKETTGVSKAVEARKPYTGPNVNDIVKEYVPPQSTSDVKTSGAPKATGVGKQSPPPAASTPARETSREPATPAIREAAGTKTTDTGKGKAPGTVSGAGKQSSREKPAGVGKESAGVKPGDVGKESAGGQASGDSRKSDDGAQVSKDKDKKGVSPIRFLNR